MLSLVAAISFVTLSQSAARAPGAERAPQARQDHPQAVRPETVRPAALRSGDTIGLLAPASHLSGEQIDRAVTNLRAAGYRVKVARNARGSLGYLAGSDAARLADLEELFKDREVKAIVCMRGGYGSPRLLDRIDYELIRRNPKILVGYSDITALAIAARKETGLVVFHGPMAIEWSRRRGLSPFSERYYWEAFRSKSAAFADWGGQRAPSMARPRIVAPGIAQGRLVGGNLSVICALMGTRYELDTREGILFIEDVGEKLFRIDRMLNQLRLAGKLQSARGVLVGNFWGCEERDGPVTLREVVDDYLLPLGVPVLADFPAGHAPDHATLPLGVLARLDAGARRLSLVEAPCQE